jgi:hypothetical protein
MGMADFYIALQDFKSAAHALAVTERVLMDKLASVPGDVIMTENTREKMSELEVRVMYVL